MANEIMYTAQFRVSNGFLSEQKAPGTLQIDMSGDQYSGVVQEIGTSYEQVEISSEVGTEGWAFFRNTDSTNYVEIGLEVAAAFYPFIKLKPGEYCFVRLGTGTVHAKADTAAVNLEIFVLED